MVTLPAGPVPLIPNRLWSWAASWLPPHPDSSMAWAMVTEAGTPKRCWAAIAPGATSLMNACCTFVPGAVALAGAVLLRYGADGAGVADRADGAAAATRAGGVVMPAGAVSPGMSALACGAVCRSVPIADAAARVPPVAGAAMPLPGTLASPACAVAVGGVTTVPGMSADHRCAAGRATATPCAVGAVCFAGACAACSVAVPPAEGGGLPPRWPLSTKPSTPACASGSLNEWALTVRLGSESAPIVSRTPWA